MKKLLPITLCFFVAICCRAQGTQGQNGRYNAETIITDLNADGKNDTISLYELPLNEDPGKFTKLTVSIDGRRITYTAKDAWDTIDKDFAKTNKNAVKSPYVFVYKESECSYVLLFGFPYTAGREEFSILKVSGRKQEMLFDNMLEEPKLLADLNNDGHAELVTQNPPEIFRITDKEETGAYSPFLIYTLFPVFNIDKALTEKYNREHYVWAGIEYNAGIEVLYPKDGSKPKLLKTN